MSNAQATRQGKGLVVSVMLLWLLVCGAGRQVQAMGGVSEEAAPSAATGELSSGTEGLSLPAELLGELDADELAALQGIVSGMDSITQELESLDEERGGLDILMDKFAPLRKSRPEDYWYQPPKNRQDPFYPLLIPTMTATITQTPQPTPTVTSTPRVDPEGGLIYEAPPTFTPTLSPTPTFTPVPRPPLRLEAVYVGSQNRRVAVVDRHLLTIGDEIFGARVIDIQDKELWVEYYGVKFVYRTREEEGYGW